MKVMLPISHSGFYEPKLKIRKIIERALIHHNKHQNLLYISSNLKHKCGFLSKVTLSFYLLY